MKLICSKNVEDMSIDICVLMSSFLFCVGDVYTEAT